MHCGDAPLAPRGQLNEAVTRRSKPHCLRSASDSQPRHVSAHAWEAVPDAEQETRAERVQQHAWNAPGAPRLLESALKVEGPSIGSSVEGVQQSQGVEPVLTVRSKRPLPGGSQPRITRPSLLRLNKGGSLHLSSRRGASPPPPIRIASRRPSAAHDSKEEGAAPLPLHLLLQRTLGVEPAEGSRISDGAETNGVYQREEEPVVVVLRAPPCSARALAFLVPVMQQVGTEVLCRGA